MTDNNPDVRKPLILIAEDVESNYKFLEIILKKEYDLLWAKNGREAVDFAMEHKPDAILMDIKMPVMDGIEALKEIRRHTAELPVIMQTAYAFDTDRRTAEEAGCNGFITKPVMPRELKMYLDKYLNKITEKVREQPSQIRLTPTPSPAAGARKQVPRTRLKTSRTDRPACFFARPPALRDTPLQTGMECTGAVSDGHRAARPVRTPPAASVRSAPRSSRPPLRGTACRAVPRAAAKTAQKKR